MLPLVQRGPETMQGRDVYTPEVNTFHPHTPYGVLCVSSLIVVYCSCSVCAGCAAGSCAGSFSYLAQCRQSGDFFPKSAVFALVWGISVRGWGIFVLAIVFLGCASGVAF